MLPTNALSASDAITTIQGELAPILTECPYTPSEIQAYIESFCKRQSIGDTAAGWEFVQWFQSLVGTQWDALPETIERLQGTPIETLPAEVHRTLIEIVNSDPGAEDLLSDYARAVGQCSDGGSY